MIIGDFKCHCGKCTHSVITLRLARALYELIEILPSYANIILHSVCRCEEHNKKIGGSPFSKHISSDAIDAHCDMLDLIDFLRAIETVEYFYNGGIGFYEVDGTTGWIHFDVRQQFNNDGSIHRARWYKKNGVFVPSKGLFITN